MMMVGTVYQKAEHLAKFRVC